MIKEWDLEAIWQQLVACGHQKQAAAYPYVEQPGVYTYAKTKEAYIVMGAYKMRFIAYESEKITVIEPVIYQSCMKPDEVWIYPLVIKKGGNESLLISCHYESYDMSLKDMQLEILPWEAAVNKTNCSKCVNCGKCSW